MKLTVLRLRNLRQGNASSQALWLGMGLRQKTREGHLEGESVSPEKHHVQSDIVLKTDIGLTEEIG